MLKQDKHGGLRVSDCRSVIPYIHGEDCRIAIVILYVVQALS
jgi:hypothetical protein